MKYEVSTIKMLLTVWECNKTHHWTMNVTSVGCFLFAIVRFLEPPGPQNYNKQSREGWMCYCAKNTVNGMSFCIKNLACKQNTLSST